MTVSQLKEIGEYLIDIHGQNDNQSLLRNKNQVEYIDNYSGSKLLLVKEEYRNSLAEFRSIDKK